MTALTLKRARAIIEHAENAFGSGRTIKDAAEPFLDGGASSRHEARNALLVVVADTYQLTSSGALPPGVPKDFFEHYVNTSRPIATRIICDQVRNPDEMGKTWSACTNEYESFVAYIKSLDPRQTDFWPLIYARLGMSWPAQSASLEGVMDESLGTTQGVNRYVFRDTIGTLIGLLVYVGLVLLLLGHLRGIAVVLFWLGAVVTGLRALQVFFILVTGPVLFFARRAGWRPSGPDPNTGVASVVRIVEFSIDLYAIYYLYAHIYPDSRFLGYF